MYQDDCFLDRVQRLKDARSEASKEIEAYKAAKEKEFQEFERSVRPKPVWLLIELLSLRIYVQHQGTTQTSQSAVDKETESKLTAITESYQKNKEQVVKKLLDRVVLVKPELHRNLKKLENWIVIPVYYRGNQ